MFESNDSSGTEPASASGSDWDAPRDALTEILRTGAQKMLAAAIENEVASYVAQRAGLLDEGHACTWRTLVIKVACRVIVRTRRVLVQFSSSWPWAGHLQHVAKRLSG